MSNMPEVAVPLTDETIDTLGAGSRVTVTGTLYTARDQAHKRLVEAITAGAELPIPLAGQVLFYAGPAPAAPGRAIGSIGPTTSSRMDSYTAVLLESGIKGMIGKGDRSDDVIEAIERHHAVYFAALGGAAALLARFVIASEVVAYADLGPEAIYRLDVKGFPVVVAVDCRGGNVYRRG